MGVVQNSLPKKKHARCHLREACAKLARPRKNQLFVHLFETRLSDKAQILDWELTQMNTEMQTLSSNP